MTEENCKQVIDDIRRNLGVGSGNGGGEIAENLHQAIERLSEDLYSKDVHFILELIQNAEDNQYQDGEEPKLKFEILSENPINGYKENGALLLVNNESGFTNENVRAICRVGGSTKDKTKGYIGEKGIGFKSVFLISEQPYIFSAGYSFYFKDSKDKETGFGYIVPYWVENYPEFLRDYYGQTCILLPFREGKLNKVYSELNQIAIETILFLDKLKSIEIDLDENTTLNVKREDQNFPIVKLLTTHSKSLYWLCELDKNVPITINEEKRQKIKNRKISIAFPIEQEKFPEISVYAFLPTSSSLVSGFEFLINADFILSSSREQIQEDRPWNIWLRDCLPKVFMSGFKQMLQNQENKYKAYRFIPLEDTERSPFFQPVAEEIVKNLKEECVILTEDGSLVKPSEARFASQKIRDLFLKETKPKLLNEIKLVAEPLEDTKLLEKLIGIGVNEITNQEILQCLEDETWIKEREKGWFLELYRFLKEIGIEKEENWKRSKIILADDGNLFCPAENKTLYLPSKEAHEVLKEYKNVVSFLEIRFLDDEIYSLLHEEIDLETWVKKNLGFSEFDIAMLCQELALRLRNEIDQITVKEVLWASSFIADHISQLKPEHKSEIRKNLPFILEDESILLRENLEYSQQLVLPENHDPETGWQFVFPEPEDRTHLRVLSNLYLDGKSEKEKDKWVSFLSLFEAKEFPNPRKKESRYFDVYKNELVSPDYLLCWVLDESPFSTDGYKLQNWEAPNWLNDEDLQVDEKKSLAMMKWLDGQLSSDGLYWEKIQLYYFFRKEKKIENVSSIKYLLRNTKWVTSTKGFELPGKVFVKKDEIFEIFGNSLPYIDANVSEKAIKFLGVNTSISFEDIIKLLKTISNDIEKTDLEITTKIYTYLSLIWNNDGIEEFSNHPMIFINNPKKKWVKTNEAIWNDRSDVFGDAFVYLEKQYNDLEVFFCEKLKIRKDANDEAYAQAWLNLINNQALDEKSKMKSLEKIYPVILRVAKQKEKPDWWGDFKNEFKFWSNNKKFISLQSIYIPDDGVLEDIFNNKTEFVWVPENSSLEKYTPMFLELGVKKISEAVKVSLKINSNKTFFDRPKYLSNEVKKAVCVYLWNRKEKAFSELKKQGVIEKFLRTIEVTVNQLRIIYKLVLNWVDDDNQTVFFDLENMELIFLKGFENEKKAETEIDLAANIARIFINGEDVKEFENYLGTILLADKKKIEYQNKRENWTLSETEDLWIEEILQDIKEKNNEALSENEVIDNFDNQPENESTSQPDGDSKQKPDTDFTTQPDSETVPQPDGKTTPQPDGEPVPQPDGDPTSQLDDEPTPPPNGGTTPQPDGDSKPQPRSITWRRSNEGQGKYVTYPRPKGDRNSPNNRKPDNSKINEIERKGVAFVMAYEREHGRIPKDRNNDKQNFPGYDIESADFRGWKRYIEVKSTENELGERGVSLSDVQFDKAKELGEKFWLYIVENALNEKKKLYRIQDPANKVTDFVFDKGWKNVAEEEEDAEF